MMGKDFLQGRIKFFIHDHIKDELFPTIVYLKFPQKKTGNDRFRTFSITALVPDLSQEDSQRFSIENEEMIIVDIFLEDLETLKTNNPTAYIPTKNLQKNTTLVIDGKDFKIFKELPDEGFETAIRLICQRVVQS